MESDFSERAIRDLIDKPTGRVEITWPGPISHGILDRFAHYGYVLERWTPELAVFVQGDWSKAVLNRDLHR